MSSAEEKLEAIHGLHVREIRWQINTYPELSFDTFADAEDMSDGSESGFSYFELCVECKRIEEGPNGENCQEVGYATSLWPCETIRAIEEAR